MPRRRAPCRFYPISLWHRACPSQGRRGCSGLLGAYRSRSIILTVISVLLVTGLLAWRYGARGAFWTILPPITAALLVPALISLGGEPFTFFHAMGLVLVVAIGVDYTIFCAETPRGH